MNTKYLYLSAATALLMLAGCTVDIQPEQAPVSGTAEGDLVPVEFTVGKVASLTRVATNIETFDNNEDVMIFVKPDGASDYTGFVYKTITATAAQSVELQEPDVAPYFPPGTNTTVEAYAYYPATAGDSPTFTVQDNQTTAAAYKASDLVFAANRTITKGVNDGSNHLQMAHLMAQLQLNIIGQGLDINRVLVMARRSVSFSVDGAGLPTIAVTDDAASNILASTTDGYAYVLIPQQPMNAIVITVETGAQNDPSTTAMFTLTNAANFMAGKSYPITITVSGVQLGSTTEIVDWVPEVIEPVTEIL